LAKLFQTPLQLRWLFQFPTVASLSEKIRTIDAVRTEDEEPALEPVSRDERLPLSYAQQRLWFLTQLQPDSAFYEVATGMRIRGWLNSAALAAAIETLVMRHESLRTIFSVDSEGPIQLIPDTLPSFFSKIDLTHVVEKDLETNARDLLRREAEKPSDLSRGPLFKATLVRLSDIDHVFLIKVHHIVSDGWSMAIMFRDIEKLYDAYCENRPSPLPELKIQYVDYAVWQRKYLNKQRLENLSSFWKSYLAGAPLVLELPTDKVRPTSPSYSGADLSIKFSSRLSLAFRMS